MLINNLSCKEWNKLLRRLQIGKTLLAQEISRPSKHSYGGLASYMIVSLRCEKKKQRTYLNMKRKDTKESPGLSFPVKVAVDLFSPAQE